MVEIRVADRGPGIPKEELSHIFDTFYRGKRAVEDQIHGTGLGLSLVKRIIEAHAGTVTAESEPGKGTEFVVRIPAAPATKLMSSRILLIEDEPGLALDSVRSAGGRRVHRRERDGRTDRSGKSDQ